MSPSRIAELANGDLAMRARRVREPLEDRIIEAQELDKHAEEMEALGLREPAISLEESLASDPPLTTTIEGDASFLDDIRAGYALDPLFKEIIAQPDSFKLFTLDDGLLYCNNTLGNRVLCIPRCIH
ncbi:hypothetical protein R3P38DRAFT_2480034, partial [Favolaschia claudopus]